MATDSLVMEHKMQQAVAEQRRATWKDYVSMAKLGITVANLMSTFAGFWVASHGHPKLSVCLWTLIGTALVVASGATLNNYVDRDIDPRMERTKHRAVASGKVPPANALAMGLILGAAGLAVLAVLVNWVAALCGLIGLVMYAYVYTVWLKRTTTLSTVLGGIAGAMPPLIGFAAGSGGVLDACAWAIFFTFFLWQPPHFLPLAMKRSEEYRAAGIPMLPVVRGFRETKWQILIYTAAMWPVSLLPYSLGYENLLYLAVSFVLGLVFLIECIRGLFVRDDVAWANRVFRYSLIYLTAMCVVMVLGTIGL